ncbi:MAG: glycerate kinase [Pseudomonadota bacterium]
MNNLFTQALHSVDPDRFIANHLPPHPKGRTIVVGAGKSAAKMARAFEEAWDGPIAGLVITRHDHQVACKTITVEQASHPVPDRAGMLATDKIMSIVQSAGKDDLVVCLISGGGSALLHSPIDGITLQDKQDINAQLLASGASIDEMNCVRKQLSKVKGGRLALMAAPAKVYSLLISDVPGDDPAIIASGPTICDETQLDDALAIIDRYELTIAPHIITAMRKAPPKPSFLSNSMYKIVATPQIALRAAQRASDIPAYILGDSIEGEAKDVAKTLSAIALQIKAHDHPFLKPCVLLSGGETTVTLRDKSGVGGRNVEFLLALAIQLRGVDGISAIACDTDGIDGIEPVAGAFITPDTLASAKRLGLKPQDYLSRNNAHSFFRALDAQIITGATLTNVNDFRAILIR